MTVRRGPRGDLSRARVLACARELLQRNGSPATVSLRSVAAELGVAPNALYTYVSNLDDLWHSVADDALGEVAASELADAECRACALTEIARRTRAVFAKPGVMALMQLQPVLGPNSFELSETVMGLCADAVTGPRDAHDLLTGWVYGSSALSAEGWDSGTDAIRAESIDPQRFPLIAARSEARPDEQLAAALRGLGIECVCRRLPERPDERSRTRSRGTPTR